MLTWFLITYRNGKQIDVYTTDWLKRFTKFRRIERVEIFNDQNEPLKIITTKKELKEWLKNEKED